MTNQGQRKTIISIVLISFLIALFVFFSLSSVGVGGNAHADTSKSGYTDVMDDLSKDETFTPDTYPAKENDYSLRVFQIAESNRGELFLYVYQPCANIARFSATYLNMALSEKVSNGDTSYTVSGNEFSSGANGNPDGSFGGSSGGGFGGGGGSGRSALKTVAASSVGNDSYQLYSLKLVSNQGVFGKYLVNGFTVLEDKFRTYNIASIYREWDGSVDAPADKDNTTSHVAYKVGQLWTAATFNNTVEYDVEEWEVIDLTSQMIGVHRYNDGFQFDGTKILDSHYLAFTCDHKIDKLKSADLEFDTRTYTAHAGSGTEYGNLSHHRVTLYDYQVANNDGSGWFGKKEEWHRMTSVKEFIKEVDLTDEEINNLSSYSWILNFYESEFNNEAGGKDVLISGLLPFGFIWTIVNACTTSGELVFDVSLLRLEFEYGGKIFNMGVVSDISSGSNKPTNGNSNFWEWLANLLNVDVKTANIIFWCFVGIVILAIALPILSAIFPTFKKGLWAVLRGIGYVFKYIGLGLWFVISAPFKLIGYLIEQIKTRREQQAQEQETEAEQNGDEKPEKKAKSKQKREPTPELGTKRQPKRRSKK